MFKKLLIITAISIISFSSFAQCPQYMIRTSSGCVAINGPDGCPINMEKGPSGNCTIKQTQQQKKTDIQNAKILRDNDQLRNKYLDIATEPSKRDLDCGGMSESDCIRHQKIVIENSKKQKEILNKAYTDPNQFYSELIKEGQKASKQQQQLTFDPSSDRKAWLKANNAIYNSMYGPAARCKQLAEALESSKEIHLLPAQCKQYIK